MASLKRFKASEAPSLDTHTDRTIEVHVDIVSPADFSCKGNKVQRRGEWLAKLKRGEVVFSLSRELSDVAGAPQNPLDQVPIVSIEQLNYLLLHYTMKHPKKSAWSALNIVSVAGVLASDIVQGPFNGSLVSVQVQKNVTLKIMQNMLSICNYWGYPHNNYPSNGGLQKGDHVWARFAVRSFNHIAGYSESKNDDSTKTRTWHGSINFTEKMGFNVHVTSEEFLDRIGHPGKREFLDECLIPHVEFVKSVGYNLEEDGANYYHIGSCMMDPKKNRDSSAVVQVALDISTIPI